MFSALNAVLKPAAPEINPLNKTINDCIEKATSLIAQSEFQKANRCYTLAIDLASQDKSGKPIPCDVMALLHYERGVTYQRLYETQSAVNNFYQALEWVPAYAPARAQIDKEYIINERINQFYQNHLTLFKHLSPAELQVERKRLYPAFLYYYDAETSFNNQEYELAEKQLNKMLAIEKIDIGLFLRGFCLFLQNKHAPAIENYTQTIHLTENTNHCLRTTCYLNRGTAYFTQKNYDFARQDAVSGMVKDYHTLSTHFYQALVDFFYDCEEALHRTDSTAPFSPKNVYQYAEQAQTAFDAGQYQVAIENASIAIWISRVDAAPDIQFVLDCYKIKYRAYILSSSPKAFRVIEQMIEFYCANSNEEEKAKKTGRIYFEFGKVVAEKAYSEYQNKQYSLAGRFYWLAVFYLFKNANYDLHVEKIYHKIARRLERKSDPLLALLYADSLSEASLNIFTLEQPELYKDIAQELLKKPIVIQNEARPKKIKVKKSKIAPPARQPLQPKKLHCPNTQIIKIKENKIKESSLQQNPPSTEKVLGEAAHSAAEKPASFFTVLALEKQASQIRRLHILERQKEQNKLRKESQREARLENKQRGYQEQQEPTPLRDISNTSAATITPDILPTSILRLHAAIPTAYELKSFAKISLLPFEVTCLERLLAFGKHGYITGGIPRDRLLHPDKLPDPLADIDIVTDADEAEIKKAFTGPDIQQIKKLPDAQHVIFSIYFHSGRVIDVKISKNLRQIYPEGKNRDFTINRFFANKNGEVFACHAEDIKHLQDNELRFVSTNIKQTLADFPLRILRAIYFLSKLNKHLSSKVEIILQNCSMHLLKLPASQINVWLKKLLISEYAEKNFDLMLKYNIWQALFPTLNETLTLHAAWIKEKIVNDCQSLNDIYSLIFLTSHLLKNSPVNMAANEFLNSDLEANLESNLLLEAQFKRKTFFYHSAKKILPLWGKKFLEDKDYPEFITQTSQHPAFNCQPSLFFASSSPYQPSQPASSYGNPLPCRP